MAFAIDNALSSGQEGIWGQSVFSDNQLKAYGLAKDVARNYATYGAKITAQENWDKADMKRQKELIEAQKSGSGGSVFSSFLNAGLSLGLKAITGGLA